MSGPSKIHTIPLVEIQPEERLAPPSELNLALSLVTGCCEALEKGYRFRSVRGLIVATGQNNPKRRGL